MRRSSIDTNVYVASSLLASIYGAAVVAQSVHPLRTVSHLLLGFSLYPTTGLLLIPTLLAPNFYDKHRPWIVAIARVVNTLGMDLVMEAAHNAGLRTLAARLTCTTGIPGIFYGLTLPLPEHPWVNLASLILGQALWRNRSTYIESYSPAWRAAAHVYFLVMGIVLPVMFNEYVRRDSLRPASTRKHKLSLGALYATRPRTDSTPSDASTPSTEESLTRTGFRPFFKKGISPAYPKANALCHVAPGPSFLPSAGAGPAVFKFAGTATADDLSPADRARVAACIEKAAEARLGRRVKAVLTVSTGCVLLKLALWAEVEGADPESSAWEAVEADVYPTPEDVAALLPESLRDAIAAISRPPPLTVRPAPAAIAAPAAWTTSGRLRRALLGAGGSRATRAAITLEVAGTQQDQDGLPSVALSAGHSDQSASAGDVATAAWPGWCPVAYFAAQPGKLQVEETTWAGPAAASASVSFGALLPAHPPTSLGAATLMVGLEGTGENGGHAPAVGLVLVLPSQVLAELCDASDSAAQASAKASLMSDLEVVLYMREEHASLVSGGAARAWPTAEVHQAVRNMEVFCGASGMDSTAALARGLLSDPATERAVKPKPVGTPASAAAAAPRSDAKRRPLMALMPLLIGREGASVRFMLVRSACIMATRMALTLGGVGPWGDPRSGRRMFVGWPIILWTILMQGIGLAVSALEMRGTKFTMPFAQALIVLQYFACIVDMDQFVPNACKHMNDAYTTSLFPTPLGLLSPVRGPAPTMDLMAVVVCSFTFGPPIFSLFLRSVYVVHMWLIFSYMPACNVLGYKLPLLLTASHLVAESGVQWVKRQEWAAALRRDGGGNKGKSKKNE